MELNFILVIYRQGTKIVLNECLINHAMNVGCFNLPTVIFNPHKKIAISVLLEF